VDPSTNTAGAVVDDADADDDDRAHDPAAAAKNRLAELLTPRIFVREVQRRAAVTRVDVISGNFNQIDRSQTVGSGSFSNRSNGPTRREKGL